MKGDHLGAARPGMGGVVVVGMVDEPVVLTAEGKCVAEVGQPALRPRSLVVQLGPGKGPVTAIRGALGVFRCQRGLSGPR